MDGCGEYSSLHGTCCSNPSKCVLFKNDDEELEELEDDVFSLERRESLNNFSVARTSTVRSSGYVSDLSPPPESNNNQQPVLEVSKSRSDVMTQTDFPVEETLETQQPETLALPTPEPSAVSPRRENVFRSFCWRHDGYSDVASPPARPCSPSSDDQDEAGMQSTGVSPRVGYQHQSCQICKTHFENRLDLKSRKELTRIQKKPADPAVAKVTSCPINLLADKISRCSSLWMEDRTFYLGVDAVKVEENSRARRHSARLPSRHSGKSLRNYNSLQQTRSCSFCNDDEIDDVTERSQSVACGRHSFWIRSLTLPRGKKSRPTTAWDEPRGVKGRKNWILVQCVTKHSLKPLCSAEPEPKLFYREIGVQEMILCPAENRTVEVIEDICCQHFIKISRGEALEGSRTIELLFSAKGPMVRDDKHLTGRSIFYFCCDEPMERRHLCDACKAANEARNTVPPPPVFSVSSALPRDQQSRHRRRRSSSSNTSIIGASPLPSTLGPVVRVRSSSKSKASAGLTSLSAYRAAPDPYACSTNAFASASAEQSEKSPSTKADKTKREKRKKSGKMPKVDEGKEEDLKKSVTFADNADQNNSEPQIDPAALKRRASLPPPPPKLIPKKDGVDRSKKRRESMRMSFTEMPPTIPNKEKTDEAPKKPSPVRGYNQPQWNSILVTVNFKGERYKQEFLEYKNLQDLYTWLRQKFLEKEVLTPGAELVLHHDNLKFPLKANTANTQISNLPTTEFTCDEISKEQQGGSFGEGSSRFDTRFSLPIDMRSLEKLTPSQYLAKFCKLPPTWRAFYRNTFTQNDKDRDGKLTFKELDQAMEHLFVELAVPLLNRVLFLMGIDPRSANLPEDEDRIILNSYFRSNPTDVVEQGRKRSVPPWQSHLTVDSETFISMCALGNRIICREKEIDGFPVDSISQRGTELEDADFYNIEGKLKPFNLNPATRKLLIYIRNR